MSFRIIYRDKIPFLLLLLMIGAGACREASVPKPTGYYRIDMPAKAYLPLGKGFPYHFEIPVYSEVITRQATLTEPYWINLSMPFCKGELHISYKEVKNNLSVYTEESRKLAYDHTVKASSIEEELFRNPGRRVSGTVYHINGNAASPMQFYLTDSTEHFIRGSLYIRAAPNIDSLKPVIAFLKEDVVRLIETFSWTE